MKGQWSVLAPVGGISIYSDFKIELHPIRLTLETQLGNKILAYILPGRHGGETHSPSDDDPEGDPIHVAEDSLLSIPSSHSNRSSLTSRSLSNLTLIHSESTPSDYHAPGLPKSRSSTALIAVRTSPRTETHVSTTTDKAKDEGSDIYQMQHRSNQKTFVHAEIPR